MTLGFLAFRHQVHSFPMSGSPNPTAVVGVFIPVTGHPGGVDTRTVFPMARDPHPLVAGIRPVTGHPGVRFARRDADDFRSRCWRLFADDNRPCRCCCSWFAHNRAMAVHTTRQQHGAHRSGGHSIQYFSFHNSLFSRRAASPLFNGSPAGSF